MQIHDYATLAADFVAIATCLSLLIKPFRNKLLGMETMLEGNRCLLRAEIVRMYYRHLKDKQMEEYEYKLCDSCYKAYKAMGGNSFIDRIWAEMQNWSII